MIIMIKGMEMPVFEHQSWDIRKGADGKWYVVDTNAETSDGVWHEIVPVPLHGRLIDSDALKEKWTHRDLDLFSQGWGWLHDLNQAPTIIPASEEGE